MFVSCSQVRQSPLVTIWPIVPGDHDDHYDYGMCGAVAEMIGRGN
jgi:hypothetical protein